MKYIFLIAFCGLSYLSLAQVGKNRTDDANYRATRDSLNKIFPKNTLYFELLGSGGLASINYDRIFYQHKNFKLSYRVGFMVMPPFSVKIGGGTLSAGDGYTQTFLPIGLNWMYGKRNKFLEFGLGYTLARFSSPIYKGNLWVGNELRINHLGVVSLGYRRQFKKGLFFKSGVQAIKLLNPATSPNGAKVSGFLPWVNISIGKSF